MVKDPPAKAGGAGSIPGSGRSPGEGNGNPLQYSCLENPHGQRSLVGYSPWGHKGVRNDSVSKYNSNNNMTETTWFNVAKCFKFKKIHHICC